MPIPVRLEAEYSQAKLKYDYGLFPGSVSSSAKTRGAGLNAYLDFFTSAYFSAYVGAGLGLYRQSLYIDDGAAAHKYSSGTEDAWQYMVGARFSLPGVPLGLGVEYRRMNVKFGYDAIGDVRNEISAIYTRLSVSL